jgi:hypothetical protein
LRPWRTTAIGKQPGQASAVDVGQQLVKLSAAPVQQQFVEPAPAVLLKQQFVEFRAAAVEQQLVEFCATPVEQQFLQFAALVEQQFVKLRATLVQQQFIQPAVVIELECAPAVQQQFEFDAPAAIERTQLTKGQRRITASRNMKSRKRWWRSLRFGSAGSSTGMGFGRPLHRGSGRWLKPGVALAS